MSDLRSIGPVVEHPGNESSLILAPLAEIMLSGNFNAVPILFGYCNREGMFSELVQKLKGKQPIHEDFEKTVPRELNLKYGSDASKNVARRIKEFYYGDEEPSLNCVDNYYLVSINS